MGPTLVLSSQLLWMRNSGAGSLTGFSQEVAVKTLVEAAAIQRLDGGWGPSSKAAHSRG